MTTEIKDPEFARFVDELSNSLSMGDLSSALGVLESIAMSALAVYDALATPEPGFLARAFKGITV